MKTTAFQEWVANTVQELGGNKAQCLRDLRQKLVPTSLETRAVACQVLLRRKMKNSFKSSCGFWR